MPLIGWCRTALAMPILRYESQELHSVPEIPAYARAGAINLWQRRRGHTASDLETSSEEGDEWRAEQLKQEEKEDKVRKAIAVVLIQPDSLAVRHHALGAVSPTHGFTASGRLLKPSALCLSGTLTAGRSAQETLGPLPATWQGRSSGVRLP